MELTVKTLKLRMIERLGELIKMFSDEDDEEVTSIDIKSVENFLKVIDSCEDDDLSKWILSSNNQGALCLEYLNEPIFATVNIGVTHITYFYSDNSNGTNITGEEPFSTQSVIGILIKPNEKNQ